MATYNLGYGHENITISIPQENVAFYHKPILPDYKIDCLQGLKKALAHPIGKDPQKMFYKKRVAIMLADYSRDEPTKEIVTAIAPYLLEASKVKYIICTGTHDPSMNKNLVNEILSCINNGSAVEGDIIIHDCRKAEFDYAGITSFNNKIFYNKIINDIDIFWCVSDLKPHYFAGYSNPLKSFVPGIAAFGTIEKNHSLSLDDNATFGRHPLHYDLKRRKQPLAEDMLEAMHMIVRGRPIYVLLMIYIQGQLYWSAAGDLESALPKGLEAVDKLLTFTVDPVEKLIIAAGMYPQDESLYSAQRALELTKYAIFNGGEILFLANCENGIGPEKSIDMFYNKLTSDIPDILKDIEKDYKLYAHKSYKFAKMIQSVNKIYVYSSLPNELISKIHLTPAKDYQVIIDGWVNEKKKIGIFDEAGKLAILSTERK
ncbi:MAG: lactate racemase domain-containing protein [bacterium]